ncbi:WXG100 family type VII secretion target [Bacillus sp. DX1.1]|uniref:WXG100 family type VII secretion target n=1 Tax=Bacillus sp. DX3.1 TaxID=3052091 RepID=UPI00257106A9|nr:WXG100 family type VII secretion target [Bacillus sp. DX3.1]MDM5153542.1 WXG100 family type VII secretion target [Bacillus sp. DX1.1]WJE82494.1 WXG100 family type VII secretion target [Bacillus sp. DX3.1]
MVKIQVRPDTLEEIASSFARAKEDSKKRIQDLTLTIFNLQMQWIGTSQQRFYSDFFEAKKHMESYIKHLNFTELELRKIARKFREADEKAYGNYDVLEEIWTGVQRGAGKAVEDTVEGVKDFFGDVKEFAEDLWTDPEGVYEDIKEEVSDFIEDPFGKLEEFADHSVQQLTQTWNVLSDSFIRDVIYGGAEDTTAWFAYALTSVGLGVAGTKGTGALRNGVRWGRDLPSMFSYEMRGGLSPAYGGNSYLRRPNMESPSNDTFRYSMAGVSREYSHLKDLDNFKVGTKEDALKHIFQGELTKKGKAIGFHYKGTENAQGKIIGEIEGPNKQGIYQANVAIDGKLKNAKSTFFPKDWTEQQVIDSINEAFNNKELYKGNRYIGITTNGIKIEMQIKNGKITSAYPIYTP